MKKLLILIIVLPAGTITTFAQGAKDTLTKGKTDTAFKMIYTCGILSRPKTRSSSSRN